MTIELVIALIGAAGTVLSGYWAITRIVVSQFNRGLDQRFADLEKARQEGREFSEKRLSRIEETQQRLERELLMMRAELPKEYVRREDDIRREVVVNAKVDALASKLDLLNERLNVVRS